MSRKAPPILHYLLKFTFYLKFVFTKWVLWSDSVFNLQCPGVLCLCVCVCFPVDWMMVFGSLRTSLLFIMRKLAGEGLWLLLLMLVTGDMWQVAHNMQYVTPATWQVTPDTWPITFNTGKITFFFFFYQCYYPHTLKHSKCPVCSIFLIGLNRPGVAGAVL